MLANLKFGLGLILNPLTLAEEAKSFINMMIHHVITIVLWYIWHSFIVVSTPQR